MLRKNNDELIKLIRDLAKKQCCSDVTKSSRVCTSRKKTTKKRVGLIQSRTNQMPVGITRPVDMQARILNSLFAQSLNKPPRLFPNGLASTPTPADRVSVGVSPNEMREQLRQMSGKFKHNLQKISERISKAPTRSRAKATRLTKIEKLGRLHDDVVEGARKLKRQAEIDAKKLEKQAENEARKLEKQAENEARKLEKQAELAKKQAEITARNLKIQKKQAENKPITMSAVTHEGIKKMFGSASSTSDEAQVRGDPDVTSTTGEGKSNKRPFGTKRPKETALTNHQLDEYLHKKLGKRAYLGTVSRDDIPNMKPLRTRPSSFIFNTSPREQPGEHWVAVHIDPKKRHLAYYDSFGRNPESDIALMLAQLAHTLRKLTFQFKINRVKEQHASSHHCGHHCARFIMKMHNGEQFKDITPFNSQEESAKSMHKEFAYI